MSSQDVIKAVSKKLKYYFEIKRLEDGFDLSGPDCPRLDHPPLRARPTLMYDGLHDRPLKHYFSRDEIRTALTNFKVKDEKSSREAAIKKLVERYMRKYHFVEHPVAPKNSSLNAAYYHQNRKGNRKLKREVQGYGIPLKKTPQHHRGGYPVLRCVPSNYASKAEAQRLINMASKLLLATESIDTKDQKHSQKQSYRPKSAASSEQSYGSDNLPVLRHSNRPQTSKSRRDHSAYAKDSKGGKSSAKSYDKGNKRHDEQPDSAYSTRPGTGSTIPSHTPEDEDSDASEKDIKPWLRQEIRKCTNDEDEIWVRNVNPPETYVTSTSEVVIEQYSPRAESPTLNRNRGDNNNNNTKQMTTDSTQTYVTNDNVLHDGDLIKYRIHVFTGQKIGAGTKADIKIALIGDKGRTEELILAPSRTHKVKFQKGQEDIFDIDCYYVGTLKKIFIGHDQKEMGTDWFLDHVIVKDLEHCYQYYINCDTWLSYRSNDKLTFRGFPVVTSSKFTREDEDDRSHSYEKQQETHIAIVHTKPVVEELPPAEERNLTFEKNGSQRGTSTLTEYSGQTPTMTSTDSDTTTTYTTSDTASSQYKTRGFSSRDVITPRSNHLKKRSDTFFDQPVINRDYSSVIESLSVTTDQENQDRVDVTLEASSDRDRVQPPMTLRPVETHEENAEAPFVRGRTDSSDSESEEQADNSQEAQLANTSQSDDRQMLFEAVRNGDIATTKQILANNPNRKNEVDEHGWSLLHIAADAGHTDIVQWLTEHIVDLETETSTGYTPMHLAAIRGHVDCMRILFSMGAPVNSRNHNGETPLYMAAKHGQLEAVKYLVSNKAEIEVRDVLGYSALDVAKSSGMKGAKQCYHYLQQCLEEIKAEKKGKNPRSAESGSRSGHSYSSSVDSSSSSSTMSSTSTSPSRSTLVDTKEDEKHRHEEEIEEKRRLYQEQQTKMAERQMTFMDSIRSEIGQQ